MLITHHFRFLIHIMQRKIVEILVWLTDISHSKQNGTNQFNQDAFYVVLKVHA